MLRKDGARMTHSISAPQAWAVTVIWLFLAFFCYEMMREQSDRLFHLAEVVQGDVGLQQHPKAVQTHQGTRSFLSGVISVQTDSHVADKFSMPPSINPKEIYATFLSTRIGANREMGEFEEDHYFNSTRVLIHRLLRSPNTRSRRHILVSSPSIFVDLRSW